MMGIINYGARKAFSSMPPPEQERAEAFSTFLAYAGRYTVSGDSIIHHVEAAWRQDWVNTDQVRLIVKLPWRDTPQQHRYRFDCCSSRGSKAVALQANAAQRDARRGPD